MNRILCASVSLTVLLLITAGCSDDPLTRQKKLTNVFDGVPDLPPLTQLCEDNMEDIFNTYYQARLAESTAGSIEEREVVTVASNHPPYTEKNCEGCHDFKNRNLLIASPDKLCEICHIDFVKNKGNFIHGPVAVRDCLACHLPHSSGYPALLRESLSGTCATCHQETRLAQQMHTLVMDHNMECVNCHNAHGGDKKYFLK